MTIVTLLWCGPQGRINREEVKATSFYIGRHPRPHEGIDSLGVYALDAETLEVLASIGGVYPTVSRLHALVEVYDDKIAVRDHGPYGRGSRNGTFLNGRPIPPGSWLETRGWGVIGLASTGPRILIIVGGDSSIPQQVPALAQALEMPKCLVGGVREVLPKATLEREIPSESPPRTLKEVEKCYILASIGWRLKDLMAIAKTGYVSEGELKARVGVLLDIVKAGKDLLTLALNREIESLKAALSIVEEEGYTGLERMIRIIEVYEALLNHVVKVKCGEIEAALLEGT